MASGPVDAAVSGHQGAKTHGPGALVWLTDNEEAWVAGEIKAENADGTLEAIKKKDKKVVSKLRQEDCPLQEPSSAGLVEDMVNLNHLHEPGVLHNVRGRYERDLIYTYTGQILIAVNPFQKLPQLYSESMMDQYKGKLIGELSPHCFALADQCYTHIMRDGVSQSLLVSGESGAGKTETTKLIMQYLARRGGQPHGDERPVEQQVLQSNPLLEAFGNAKTVRNDNSSRFGKYVEIQFSKVGRIAGAGIRTYLLERSRVVHINDPERNYHIFYQLVSGASESESKEFRLSPASHFNFLNQSKCRDIAGHDNAEEYKVTRRAMEVIGLTEQQQHDVMRCVAGTLHLGNCEFATDDEDRAVLTEEGEKAVQDCSAVLQVSPDKLRHALVSRNISTPEGDIDMRLQEAAAVSSRDALAKTLYARLFEWIVDAINTSISMAEDSVGYIGLLDIYGFESFEENSFEQFCINLANEKLQQHFNQHVFKMEQQEYENEGIEWSYIEFVDNQDVLDLIEQKPNGILPLLDEACKFPNATHKDFASQLVSQNQNHPRFNQPKGRDTQFQLSHYAGKVTYETEQFLEKNKDYVVAEHQSLMQSSGCGLLNKMFESSENKEGGSGKSASSPQRKGGSKSTMRFSSVGTRFKIQLQELMEALNETEPHYVRCIKPNSQSKPAKLEQANVLHQLRCGGVLEAVRISCAGFPARKPYDEFAERYGVLAPKSIGKEPKEVCIDIVKRSKIEDYQLGHTKLFLRAGEMGVLDAIRSKVLGDAATVLQKYIRRFVCTRRYREDRRRIAVLQKHARGMLARSDARERRRQKMATKIQSSFRRHVKQSQLRRAKDATITIQACTRGYLTRKFAKGHRAESAARVIGKHWMRYSAMENLRRAKEASTVMQSHWRRVLAKRERRRLVREQRDASMLREQRDELQQRLNQELERAHNERERNEETKSKYEEDLQKLSEEKATWQQESSKLLERINEKDNELARKGATTEELTQAMQDLEGERERAKELEREKYAVEEQLAEREKELETRKDESEKAKEDLKAKEEEVRAMLEEKEELEGRGRELEQSKEEKKELERQVEQLKSEDKTEEVARLQSELEKLKQERKDKSNGELHIDTTAGSPRTPRAAEGVNKGDGKGVRNREVNREDEDALLEQFINGENTSKPSSILFRALLQWGELEKDRAEFLDRLRESLEAAIERSAESKESLSHWLATSSVLLHLLQKTLRTSSAQSPKKRGASSFISRAFRQQESRGGEVNSNNEEGGIAGVGVVEAKYPALFFKQQLSADVERTYGILRDMAKNAISQSLSECVQPPKRGKKEEPRGGVQSWQRIIKELGEFKVSLKKQKVPFFLVQNFFAQIFSFIDVQLLNTLLLRRECCSFSNGEQIKTGLSELHRWVLSNKSPPIDDAWHEIRHVREAVELLVIHKKADKSVEQITQDLCPSLSVQQLYRILTMYWDDRYGTESVSQSVLIAMKQKMMEDSDVSTSFLLDDDSALPFTVEEIESKMPEVDLNDIDPPPELRGRPGLAFINSPVALSQ